MTKAATEHDFINKWYSDSEGHWHICKVCFLTDEKLAHIPEEDDKNCNTSILCWVCDAITTMYTPHDYDTPCDPDCNNEGCEVTQEINHLSNEDGGDCTTDILCQKCDAVMTEGRETHTGGTATATAQAECEICGTPYGEFAESEDTGVADESESNAESNPVDESDPSDAGTADGTSDGAVTNQGDDEGGCASSLSCAGIAWLAFMAIGACAVFKKET